MSVADTVHRTAKIFADSGVARTLEEAKEILSGYVLQVYVGGGIERSKTRQAMLLTLINTASRAFLGGVRVQVAANPVMALPWVEGMTLIEAIEGSGGSLVEEFHAEYATIAVGKTVARPIGAVVLIPTWDGWSGGVVREPASRLPEREEFELAGVLAGAMAASEAFQFQYGYLPAGRRDVGLSLWRPTVDWRDPDAAGPPCRHLLAQAWILGLGHLGQAYCWAIGCLPYAAAAELKIVLQDFDFIVEANRSTSVLAESDSLGKRKTRLVMARLEQLGFETSIIERRFDAGTKRVHDEPVLALAGFDGPKPRRELDPKECGFNLVVDGGVGGGPQHYLDILIHSFPSSMTTKEAFPVTPVGASTPEAVAQPAYRHLVEERIDTGHQKGDAECGVIEIAGRTVAAAFVGAVASALVLAEPLRILHGGRRYEVVSFSLRTPEQVDVAEISCDSLPMIPATSARPH